MIRVAMPSVPSDPTITPSRSGPSGSSAFPPSSTISPSGRTSVSPVTWWRRESVLETVRAACVLGDVAADRADLLARRIRCVEEAVRGDGARDVEVRHARLDDDALALEVDLDDPVHPRERDDDSACHRCGASGEAGAGSACNEWHALPVTRPKDRLDVLGRSGKNDELGDSAVPGEPVAFVYAELLRLGDDLGGAERRP